MAPKATLTDVTPEMYKALLEGAAKAAGYRFWWHNPPGGGLVLKITDSPLFGR